MFPATFSMQTRSGKTISGIDYVEIKCYASEDISQDTPECTLDSVIVSARQIPDLSDERIEVVLVE